MICTGKLAKSAILRFWHFVSLWRIWHAIRYIVICTICKYDTQCITRVFEHKGQGWAENMVSSQTRQKAATVGGVRETCMGCKQCTHLWPELSRMFSIWSEIWQQKVFFVIMKTKMIWRLCLHRRASSSHNQKWKDSDTVHCPLSIFEKHLFNIWRIVLGSSRRHVFPCFPCF